MSKNFSLVAEFEASRESWVAEHPDQSDPCFWELNLNVDQSVLSGEAIFVGAAVEKKSRCDDLRAVILLFTLLRTRLSNVSINRLWPEVARELSGRDLTVTPERCGTFFRNALNRVYWSHIPADHNRFVACCLKEAAVGSDRVHIVTEFLFFLLKSVLQENDSETPRIAVQRLVERFLDRCPQRDEIAVYRIHLEYTGATVIELIRDLRSGEMLNFLSLRDWGQLRDWWWTYSGNDLNRLTPEARSALGSLLSTWHGRVTRQLLAVHVRKTGVRVASSSQQESDIDSIDNLPLGPIRIGSGENISHVQLCDEFGLTVDQLLDSAADCWHSFGEERVYVWSRMPFLISPREGCREFSRPFFAGHTVGESQLAGHYWVGRAENGILPLAIDRDFESAVPPRLCVRSFWKLAAGGFRLHVCRWKPFFVRRDRIVRLSIGGNIKWSGLLSDASQLELVVPIADPRSNPIVALLDSEDNRLCEVEVSRPWCRGAFLAVNGRLQEVSTVGCQATRLGSSDSLADGVVVGTISQQPPQVANGEVRPLVTKIPDFRFRCYRVEMRGGYSAPTIVTTSLHQWEIIDSQPVELIDADRSTTLPGGITVLGTERIKPVAFDDPMLVRLPPAWLHGHPTGAASYRLVVQTERDRLRWTATEVIAVSNAETGDPPGTVSLQALARLHSVRIPAGLLKVYLERPQAGRSEVVCMFRCPTDCTPLLGHLRERSQLVLSDEGEPFQVIHSLCEIEYKDLLDAPAAEGWIDCGIEGAVGFRWVPRVRDILLLKSDVMVDDGLLLTVADLGERLELEGIGNFDVQWIVTCGPVQKRLRTGERLNLAVLLADQAMISRDSAEQVLINVTENVNDEIESCIRSACWRFDLTPRNFVCSASWLPGERKWELNVALEWQGFESCELCVELLDLKGLTLASAHIAPERNAFALATCSISRKSSLTISVESISLICMSKFEPGVMVVRWHDRIIHQQHLPPLPDDDSRFRPVIDFQSTLNEVVRDLGTVPGCDDDRLVQIVILSERGLRDRGRLPFQNLDGLIRRIADKGSESCRRQAINCLRLLKALAEHQVRPTFDVCCDVAGPLQLFLATLVAVHQRLLFKIGQADLRIIQAAVEIFDSYSLQVESVARRNWAAIMAAWCREWSEKSDIVATSVVTTDFSKAEIARVEPLVGFNMELNDWISSK